MKTASVCLQVLLLVCVNRATAQSAGGKDYAIEMSHSTISFSINFLYSPVRGQFDQYRGRIFYDPAAPERSTVEITIDAKSIDTGSDHRDEHLRSSDFFDVVKFPAITFRSTRVERATNGLVVRGPFTLHGVTRDIAIRVTPVRAPVADPHGTGVVNFVGKTRLARKDFGILGGSRYNEWFDELRSRTMADSVDVLLEIQAWRKEEGKNPASARVSNAARGSRE